MEVISDLINLHSKDSMLFQDSELLFVFILWEPTYFKIIFNHVFFSPSKHIYPKLTSKIFFPELLLK